MVRLDSLETKPNSQTLTSSISLIHLSMPSKDHLLVMSYTSRIPWRETNDVSVQTPAAFKWMQPFAPHLSSAGVRAKDGAEPPLSRGVPEERQHIKHSGLCSCKQINPSSAFGVNSTKQQASANRTEIWADFFLGVSDSAEPAMVLQTEAKTCNSIPFIPLSTTFSACSRSDPNPPWSVANATNLYQNVQLDQR